MHSQVVDERKSFIWTMKSQAKLLVVETKKVVLSGYGLNDYTWEILAIQVSVILNITEPNQPISSITFTRHEVTGVSQAVLCKVFMYSNLRIRNHIGEPQF